MRIIAQSVFNGPTTTSDLVYDYSVGKELEVVGGSLAGSLITISDQWQLASMGVQEIILRATSGATSLISL